MWWSILTLLGKGCSGCLFQLSSSSVWGAKWRAFHLWQEATHILIRMCNCVLMAERVMALPTCASCQAVVWFWAVRTLLLPSHIECCNLLLQSWRAWFSLQKKWLIIYSFMFIWCFFRKGVKLLECVVKKYRQPPKGSNLTGMLGGRSSDCLMKMNGENCWYKNHVVGA